MQIAAAPVPSVAKEEGLSAILSVSGPDPVGLEQRAGDDPEVERDAGAAAVVGPGEMEGPVAVELKAFAEVTLERRRFGICACAICDVDRRCCWR